MQVSATFVRLVVAVIGPVAATDMSLALNVVNHSLFML